jgi:hypothetical protein
MSMPTLFYDYTEHDFIDFLYLNGYLTERPSEDLPDDPDRTPFENEIRSIATRLNCHRRKPKDSIDSFYKANFRWVFSVEGTAPNAHLTSGALLRSHDSHPERFDIIYLDAEAGMGKETLQTLWKHALWAAGSGKEVTIPQDLREIQQAVNSTLHDILFS